MIKIGNQPETGYKVYIFVEAEEDAKFIRKIIEKNRISIQNKDTYIYITNSISELKSKLKGFIKTPTITQKQAEYILIIADADENPIARATSLKQSILNTKGLFNIPTYCGNVNKNRNRMIGFGIFLLPEGRKEKGSLETALYKYLSTKTNLKDIPKCIDNYFACISSHVRSFNQNKISKMKYRIWAYSYNHDSDFKLINDEIDFTNKAFKKLINFLTLPS